MSHALVNRIKPLQGLDLAEKSALFQLADASHDGESAFLRMDRLTLYMGCSLRTARRALRKLEKKGVLIPQGGSGGRGYVHVYRFNLEPLIHPPVVTGPLPPHNGYAGQLETDSQESLLPPTNGYVKPDLRVYDDPLARRPGETATQWAARIDALPGRKM